GGLPLRAALHQGPGHHSVATHCFEDREAGREHLGAPVCAVQGWRRQLDHRPDQSLRIRSVIPKITAPVPLRCRLPSDRSYYSWRSPSHVRVLPRSVADPAPGGDNETPACRDPAGRGGGGDCYAHLCVVRGDWRECTAI